jgi:hypothetical protein
MSFEASALVLAWVAIVLLALGLAGLLRQVQLLSRGRVAEGAPGTAPAHTPRDLVGFRLPRQGPLAELVDPAAHRTVLAFVSPGCPSCTQTLEQLAAAPDVTAGSVAVVAVSTGSCDPAEAALGGAGRCVPQGRSLLEQLRVPATPYLVAVGSDGTLVAAVLPDEDTDVAGWVRHSRGPLSATEERHRE